MYVSAKSYLLEKLTTFQNFFVFDTITALVRIRFAIFRDIGIHAEKKVFQFSMKKEKKMFSGKSYPTKCSKFQM